MEVTAFALSIFVLTSCVLTVHGGGSVELIEGLEIDPDCGEEWTILDPQHSKCIINHPGKILEQTQEDKNYWVEVHNKYRGNVGEKDADKQPPAFMAKMMWDEEQAELATSWAATCKWGHDRGGMRMIGGDKPYTTGQNGGRLGHHHTNVTRLVEGCVGMWYNEVRDFTFGGPNDWRVLHFTQVTAARATILGCGIAHCTDQNDYPLTYCYCNYGPGGGYNNVDDPYPAGEERGDGCPDTYIAEEGLCDCGDKVCYSGGRLDLNTCTCDCGDKKSYYNTEDCSVDCETGLLYEDVDQCKKWMENDPNFCSSWMNHRYDKCPMSCNLCKKCDSKVCLNGGKLNLATCECECPADACKSPKYEPTDNHEELCECQEVCPGLDCNVGDINFETCTCDCWHDEPWILTDENCKMNCETGLVKDHYGEDWCTKYKSSCNKSWWTSLTYQQCAMTCNPCNKCDGQRCMNGGAINLETCACDCSDVKCPNGYILVEEAGDCSCKEVCPGLACDVGDINIETCTCDCWYDEPWILADENCKMNCETGLVKDHYGDDWCTKYKSSCNKSWWTSLTYQQCAMTCNPCNKCEGKRCPSGESLSLADCTCQG